MKYDGFQIKCGCACSRCGSSVVLEGYSDANGTHYCAKCDDYVSTYGACKERTLEKVERRERVIIKVGALND